MVLIDCAPMEGLTVYSFRQAHRRMYRGVDRYFTPFLVANQTLHFQKKEIREIQPENNEGITVIPQVLTNKPDQMLWAMEEIAGYGYPEINLNLGCPYPTVVNRHKGSGMLKDPWMLDSFLAQVFEGLEKINAGRETGKLKLSIKTRIGIEKAEEIGGILEIYNKYPICELIVHPRLQKQMYNGTPDLEAFAWIMEHASMPISYNGDILTAEDAAAVAKRFPQLHAIMLGRGLLRDPALGERIRGNCQNELNSMQDIEKLQKYMDLQYEGYKEYVLRDQEVISHIKELWFHVGHRLPDCEKLIHRLRRAKSRGDYLEAERKLFDHAREMIEYNA